MSTPLRRITQALTLAAALLAGPAAYAGGGSTHTYRITDLRYNNALSTICSGPCAGTHAQQMDFSTMFAPGDFLILSGEASQPGLYQVLAVDPVMGRWVTVSPRPQSATDVGLFDEIGKVGPLPADLKRRLIRQASDPMGLGALPPPAWLEKIEQ